MGTTQEIIALALDCGFTHAGELSMEALEFLPAVRDMCAADRCHKYGRSWTCPPGCGTLAEVSARAARYSRGVLLQTVARLEDDFDVETMQRAERDQKRAFRDFVETLRREYPDCLPMATGGCDICAQCTYPDAPCRFPDRAVPSMEAYGLLVSKVCEKSGLPYYYGPKTLAYTSCVLID